MILSRFGLPLHIHIAHINIYIHTCSIFARTRNRFSENTPYSKSNIETKLEMINLEVEIEKFDGIVWFINVFSSPVSLLHVPS